MKKKIYALLAVPIVIIGLILIQRHQNREVYEYNSRAVYVYNLTDDRKVTGKTKMKNYPWHPLQK